VIRLLDRRRNASPHRSLAALALAAPVLVALVLVVASVQLVGMVIPTIPALAIRPTPFPVVPAPTHASVTDAAASRPTRRASPERRQPRADSPVAPQNFEASVGQGAHSVLGQSAGVPVSVGVPEPRGQRSTPLQTPSSLTELPGASVHTLPPPPKDKSPTPWSAAADAGVAVGRGSQKAAAATAGFFTKLGKSIAGGF
jgi:hypothetical protein